MYSHDSKSKKDKMIYCASQPHLPRSHHVSQTGTQTNLNIDIHSSLLRHACPAPSAPVHAVDFLISVHQTRDFPTQLQCGILHVNHSSCLVVGAAGVWDPGSAHGPPHSWAFSTAHKGPSFYGKKAKLKEL